jgi:hypothetical protein
MGVAGARKNFDWAAMQAWIDVGNGFLSCRKRFGIAHATWVKAIQAGNIRVDTARKPYCDSRKRYDWAAIRAYHESGASYRKMQGPLRKRHLGEGREDRPDRPSHGEALDRRGRAEQFAVAGYHQAPLATGWYNRESLRLVRPE